MIQYGKGYRPYCRRLSAFVGCIYQEKRKTEKLGLTTLLASTATLLRKDLLKKRADFPSTKRNTWESVNPIQNNKSSHRSNRYKKLRQNELYIMGMHGLSQGMFKQSVQHDAYVDGSEKVGESTKFESTIASKS